MHSGDDGSHNFLPLLVEAHELEGVLVAEGADQSAQVVVGCFLRLFLHYALVGMPQKLKLLLRRLYVLVTSLLRFILLHLQSLQRAVLRQETVHCVKGQLRARRSMKSS